MDCSLNCELPNALGTFQLPKHETPRVDLVDDHDEIYPIWKGQGYQNEILVHLDAHADFRWIAEAAPRSLLEGSTTAEVREAFDGWQKTSLTSMVHKRLNLGNYIYQMFEEGMVGEWYWVVPDVYWTNAKRKLYLWKELCELYKFRTGEMTPPRHIKNAFKTQIMGIPTTVTSFKHLPAFKKPFLLNLDVDYLTAEPEFKLLKRSDARKRLPWIWPDELYDRFEGRTQFPHAVGIAHSVNEGYTPIQFKYFGEQLGKLFLGEKLPEEYHKLRKALFLRNRDRTDEALELLELFKASDALEAARKYQIMQLSGEKKEFKTAHENLQACIALDGDFATRYNTLGPVYQINAELENARQEYASIQEVDPNQLPALIEEADCLYDLGRFQEAEAKYQKAIGMDPENSKALTFLGILALERKEPQAALSYLKKAVEREPRSKRVQIALGICFKSLKQWEPSKRHLRKGLELGEHTPLTYWNLGLVYSALNLKRKSREMFYKAARIFVFAGIQRWHQRWEQLWL